MYVLVLGPMLKYLVQMLASIQMHFRQFEYSFYDYNIICLIYSYFSTWINPPSRNMAEIDQCPLRTYRFLSEMIYCQLISTFRLPSICLSPSRYVHHINCRLKLDETITVLGKHCNEQCLRTLDSVLWVLKLWHLQNNREWVQGQDWQHFHKSMQTHTRYCLSS